MKVAVIDLGTNSVRFEVYQTLEGRSAKCIYDDKLMVRLGKDLFVTKRIGDEAIERTLQAFLGYRLVLQDLGVDRVIAVGTSALREAENGAAVADELSDKSGIQLKIISGAEEARLIAQGILANESELGTAPLSLVDIGGGSTEVTIVRDGKIVFSTSLDAGAARLQQVFLRESPPVADDLTGGAGVRALREHVRSLLDSTFRTYSVPPKTLLVGSSGTCRAIAGLRRMEGADKTRFDRPHLSELVREMTPFTKEQLLAIPGMEANRVDSVVAGAILLEELMSYLRAEQARITKYSLRHGLLAEATA